MSGVCCCFCPCGLLCVFLAPWWSAYTCSLKSNDPTLKSSLVEDTHANYFLFMGAYIARPRCRLETRFARINCEVQLVRCCCLWLQHYKLVGQLYNCCERPRRHRILWYEYNVFQFKIPAVGIYTRCQYSTTKNCEVCCCRLRLQHYRLHLLCT